MRSSILILYVLAFWDIFLTGQSYCQITPASPYLSLSPSVEDASQADQAELNASARTLTESFFNSLPVNATSEQIQAWQKLHADTLARYQQLSLDLGSESTLVPQSPLAAPSLPASASPTLKSLLSTENAVANAGIQIHNQLLNALPVGQISDAQISEMRQREAQLLEQQQGYNLKLLAQRAQAVANESAGHVQSLPPPLILPASTPPTMASYLKARDRLLREQLTLLNQYATSTPQARNAALTQWAQQNVARLQQLQTSASVASPSTAAQN